MNKYFGILQMLLAGSTYWNIEHGAVPGEAEEDAEAERILSDSNAGIKIESL